jgi:hypothetical protein
MEHVLPHYTIPKDRFVKTSGSSRGYAKKAELDGLWYKVSAGAFNAQAEVVAARLAKYTNVGACVDYEMCIVNGVYATRSKDFICGRPWETIKSLHIKRYGTPVEEASQMLHGAELWDYVRNLVHGTIGIDMKESELLSKLTLLLMFDAAVLNEDRHFGNIMFKQDCGTWDLAPAFDLDCSFYSCFDDLGKIDEYRRPSLPFCRTHDEQLKMLQSLSDAQLRIEPFDPAGMTAGVWEERQPIGKKEIENYLRDLSAKSKSL